MAIGDLDGDNDLDLAVANVFSNNVSVLLNNGDGTFASDVLYGAGTAPRFVVVGDFDGDTDLDLAAANENSDNVSILLNNGDGTFATHVVYGAGGSPRSVVVGDLDGDGDRDLAVANLDSDNVSVLLNNGNGTFAAQVLYGAGDGSRSVAIGDLDGDGNRDLAVANELTDDVSVLLHVGGDCNGNGIPDACDIDQCDRTNAPDCADCNNNDVPDGCDIASGTSQDLDSNGIPDECVFYIGPVGDNNWTTFANWDLGGSDYPDNGAVSYNVTLDGTGSDVVLDTNVTIDTLNILGRASLDVSGGNLTVEQERGIEVNGDTPGLARGALYSDLFINSANNVDTPHLAVLNSGRVQLDDTGSLNVSGTLEISGGGRVSKDPAGVGVAASINAGTIVINGGSCASNTPGGELFLDDKMAVNVAGDLIMNGSLEADCLGARGGITPPPKLTVGGCGSRARTGTPTLAIGGSLLLNQTTIVSTASDCARRGADRAAGFVRVTGDFDNRTTDPFSFDWSGGSIELTASASHDFEVSGRDLGPVLEGMSVSVCVGTLAPCGTAGPPCDTCLTHTNGSFDTVRINDGATMTFVDAFDNEDYVRGAPEALYVNTLIVGTGATVIVNDCSVYYRQIIPPEAADDVDGVGQWRFEQLPAAAVDAALAAPYPHDRQKNRYISFDPNKLANAGVNVAFKIELLSIGQGSCSGNGAPCRYAQGTGQNEPGNDDCRICNVNSQPCISAATDCLPNTQACVLSGQTCANDAPTIGGSNVGKVWWVGPESPAADGRFLVVSEAFREERLGDDWADVIHVGDCEIVPQASYGIRAVEASTGTESDELVVSTIPRPAQGVFAWWADAVGSISSYCNNGDTTAAPCDLQDGGACGGNPAECALAWTEPNGFTNFDDINAALALFGVSGGAPVAPRPAGVPVNPAIPDITWVDVHGDNAGNSSVDPPQSVANFADIGAMVLAFTGRPYPYTDPADCPDVDTWP